jgi:RNA polymerase sigma-70 factor (ECF subfamily)
MDGDAHSDEVLMVAVQEGSHSAFMRLVRRHTDRNYRVAYRLVGQREAAEDVVQEVFFKLWREPTAWRVGRDGTLAGWLYRVVTNRALDRYRLERKTRGEAIDLDRVPAEGIALDDQLDERRREGLVEQALAELPARNSVALTLAFYEDVSDQVAAETMGMTRKALQSLLMRSKALLRRRVQAPGTKNWGGEDMTDNDDRVLRRVEVPSARVDLMLLIAQRTRGIAQASRSNWLATMLGGQIGPFAYAASAVTGAVLALALPRTAGAHAMSSSLFTYYRGW